MMDWTIVLCHQRSIADQKLKTNRVIHWRRLSYPPPQPCLDFGIGHAVHVRAPERKVITKGHRFSPRRRFHQLRDVAPRAITLTEHRLYRMRRFQNGKVALCRIIQPIIGEKPHAPERLGGRYITNSVAHENWR